MSGPESYTSVADRLAGRIEELISTHPEIMRISNVWDLFQVDGFECRDLEPSLYQAQWALADAQRRHREKESV